MKKLISILLVVCMPLFFGIVEAFAYSRNASPLQEPISVVEEKPIGDSNVFSSDDVAEIEDLIIAIMDDDIPAYRKDMVIYEDTISYDIVTENERIITTTAGNDFSICYEDISTG